LEFDDDGSPRGQLLLRLFHESPSFVVRQKRLDFIERFLPFVRGLGKQVLCLLNMVG
jgi:hypothetical protein